MIQLVIAPADSNRWSLGETMINRSPATTDLRVTACKLCVAVAAGLASEHAYWEIFAAVPQRMNGTGDRFW